MNVRNLILTQVRVCCVASQWKEAPLNLLTDPTNEWDALWHTKFSFTVSSSTL